MVEVMSKKPVLARKTFRLIAAYGRLPREGRTLLDRMVRYLAALDRTVFPKTEVPGKTQTLKGGRFNA
jgi:hypothetical protein